MRVLVINLNEIVETEQKKFPSFFLVAFDSAEVLYSMDSYLSHSKPLKGTKTFPHIKIVNKEIHGNLLSPDCPCHSSSANQNKDKSKFIKPERGKFHWVRYEFQCEKGGTTIKVLPAMCKKNYLEEHLFIFLKRASNDQIICMLNAGDKTWINENIVDKIPFPDMTPRRNQYKFGSGLQLLHIQWRCTYHCF